MMSSVKVAVRVRPLNTREKDLQSEPIISMLGKKTIITNPKATIESERVKEFTFDYSYWSVDKNAPNFASQEQVFADLGQDIVIDALQGYNSCIFAYGQTSSGKTYTMSQTMCSPESEGLIPRICRRLFEKIDSLTSIEDKSVSYKTDISYLEIYNEQVRDLLVNYSEDINGNQSIHRALKVREHPKYGPYVENLSKHSVHSYNEILELMKRGNFNRTTASTSMNDTSSRSHAIFIISFSKASYIANNPYETVSKINLVDLAGSERANSTQATGQRLVEGSHINKSLVTLGSVISVLAEARNKMSSPNHRKSIFIPYRDSTLTWLLKDSLGGNSKTIMIATISPAECNYPETLNTLRYANRAKNIMNKPHINEDPNTKLIRELREQIEQLTSMMGKNPKLQEQLQVNEAKVKELTQEWMNKWDDIKQILTEQNSIGIRKSGNSGVILDSDLPHLILCIDDDVLSTGVTLYQLNEGRTYIGTKFSDKKQDILINPGPDVENEHCYIDWNGQVEGEEAEVTLHPIDGALCFVNQNQVELPVQLHQGCLIVLGENNMFRFNNPREVKNIKDKSTISDDPNMAKLKRNSRLISSTTSYDSMYTSISSLNNKKLLTSFNSSIGLNEETEEGSSTPKAKSNRLSVYNTDYADMSRNPSDKVQEELNLLNSFMGELKLVLENNGKGMDTSTSSDSSTGSSALNETLETMLTTLVQNGRNNHEEAVRLLKAFDDEELLRKLYGIANEKVDKLETSLKEDLLNNNETNRNANLSIELSPKGSLETLNPTTPSVNNFVSPVLPSNILDELIQVEVERRMKVHLEQCGCNTSNHSRGSCPNRRDTETSLLAKDCAEPDQVILHIPSFYMQYLPDEHYVYEIKIRINNTAWTIYRRYKCFLNLNKQIRIRYGRFIEMPYFPPKKWLNRNNEKFVELRRRLLENYIQKLIELCKSLPDCPLNYSQHGLKHLTRECLYKFSDFFIVNTLVDHGDC